MVRRQPRAKEGAAAGVVVAEGPEVAAPQVRAARTQLPLGRHLRMTAY